MSLYRMPPTQLIFRRTVRMTMHQYLRMIAGFFVMLSVALAYFVDQRWVARTALIRVLQTAEGTG